MELKEKLSILRQEQGWSQEEVAKRLGVTRQTISKWERGMISPTTDKLIALCRLYGIPLDGLVGGEPQGGEPPATAAAEKPEETPPKKISPLRLAGAAVLAISLLLSVAASIITISTAMLKEPETPKDGVTVVDQNDLVGENIDLTEVQNFLDGVTNIDP